VIFQSESSIKISQRGGAATNTRATHLNERIKRLPACPLEVLLGVKRDLVGSGLERVRFRRIWREEIQTPPVRVRDGGSDSDPYTGVSRGGGPLGARWNEKLDSDALGWFADG